MPALLFLVITSDWISHIFLSGYGKAGIEKMRSIFFQRAKSSDVPVTQPAGCGGKTNYLKRIQYGCAVKIPNPDNFTWIHNLIY